MFREHDLSLEKAITMLQTSELAERQLTSMQEEASVHAMQGKKQQRDRKRSLALKTLIPLNIGDDVTMQPFGQNRTWLSATVKKYLVQRTYLVRTATGKDLKRNRAHLRLRPNPGDSTRVHTQPFPVPRSEDSTSVQPIVQPDVIPEDPDVPSEDTPRTTSSGRTVRRPRKLDL
ncbi:hypothetical protein CAPTEDRAFT_205034 [Capitella teleta]|uniref:Uncharacterized protein n=1 Tax=Capitella teleta TaxID=283909 RepID=R7TFD3_CAPTE|nr:hypothetical protein CAPTEDRAFT_205034 [Capitella teleta]|eukprot:ELT90256.1 hypothetical protein CAPTEDRAFT_205034 [Capitella teleta]